MAHWFRYYGWRGTRWLIGFLFVGKILISVIGRSWRRTQVAFQKEEGVIHWGLSLTFWPCLLLQFLLVKILEVPLIARSCIRLNHLKSASCMLWDDSLTYLNKVTDHDSQLVHKLENVKGRTDRIGQSDRCISPRIAMSRMKFSLLSL